MSRGKLTMLSDREWENQGEDQCRDSPAAPGWMGRGGCVPTRHSVLFQDRPVRRKQLKQIRQYVRRCKWIWLYKEERVVTLGAITEDEQFELGP